MSTDNTLVFTNIQDQYSSMCFPFNIPTHPPISSLPLLLAESQNGLLVVCEDDTGPHLLFPENPLRFSKTPVSTALWKSVRGSCELLCNGKAGKIYLPPVPDPVRDVTHFHGKLDGGLELDVKLAHTETYMDVCMPANKALAAYDALPPDMQSPAVFVEKLTDSFLDAHDTGVDFFLVPGAGLGYSLFGSAREDTRPYEEMRTDISRSLTACLPPIALYCWTECETLQTVSQYILARTARIVLKSPFWF